MLNKKRKNEKSQVIETNKVIKEVNVSNTNLQDNNYLNSCYPTLTIAIPSSIIDNAQSKELRSYLVGQIARTCSIFNIDEIVIFHDSLNKGTYKDKLNFCLTNIQYLETPNYLRKLIFPDNEDLNLVGLMNPISADHHLKNDEYSEFREGVVLNRPVKGNGSWVNIGLKKDCFIDYRLIEKTRVTVKLDNDCKELHLQSELGKKIETTKKFYTGKVVSFMEPKSRGLSWGYYVRVVDKFEDLFNCSIFNEEKYDLVIGTSDKGKIYSELDLTENSKLLKKIKKSKKIEKIKHCLIVFGGIQGLEGVVDDEEDNKITRNNISSLFDFYVNTCPDQGSRTIRTEEALMVTLSVLKDKLKSIN